MESFNLNIIPGKDRPVCHASQYDIGRTIRVNLFEGFNVFTLDGTETISISVRKPDGNVVTESVTNTSDSYVEFVTTEQMTACSGSNLCELKLEKGADVIGTMNFILEVEQDPLDGGVQSDTQIHNLQTQVAALVAIEVADQYDSADVIFDNTPTAGHGLGYAVTSEGVLNALGSLQTTLEGEIGTAVDTVEDIIADAYDENNTYNTGDYCIFNDVLYICNDDNVTGAWDGTKWDATTIADELNRVEAKITALSDYESVEVAIGKWTDGKTIYRKILTGTISGASLSLDLGEKIDTLVNYTYLIDKNGVVFAAPYRMEENTNYYQAYCFCNKGTGGTNSSFYATFASSTAGYFDSCEVTVVAEYTKRT